MKKSSQQSKEILARLTQAAVLLGILGIYGLSARAQTAPVSQTLATSESSRVAIKVAPAPGTADNQAQVKGTNGVPTGARAVAPAEKNTLPAGPAQNPATGGKGADPVKDYKTSLNSLSGLYQNEVQRLEQKNQQAKDLYHDGLISRVDLEASDKALADARAKVEEITRQIAEANKPIPAVISGDAPATLGSANQSWSTGNARIDSLIRYYGNQYSVDPYLIYCLMSQESKFATSAISPKGAQGLMQLMPGTAARYGVTNPYDVGQSIQGGTRYLKDLLKMFNGRIDLALAGYNAGENAVIKYGYTIPPYDETRNYVKLIIKRYSATASKP